MLNSFEKSVYHEVVSSYLHRIYLIDPEEVFGMDSTSDWKPRVWTGENCLAPLTLEPHLGSS